MTEEEMFDFLHEFEATRVIPAIYYAVRLINHRHELDDIYEGFRAEALESEPSSQDAELALAIIEVIEQTEHENLRNIDHSSAEDYVFQLYQIAHQRAADEFGYDADRGRELLGQFEPAMSQQVGQNSM